VAKSTKVTPETVAQEADKLVMAGQRPTIERIRAALGGGSPNTIAPLLNDWFEDLGKRLKKEHVLPPTRGVPPAVLQLYEEVRADVMVLAQEQITEGVAAARAATLEAERKEAMAWQALRDVEAQMAGMRESVEHQKETIATLQASLATARDQHLADRARIEEVERLLREAQRRAVDESTRATADVAKANSRADETVKRVMKELDAERTAHAETKKQGKKLEERLSKVEAAAALQRTRDAEGLARASTELAAAQNLVLTYSDDLSTARADLAELLRRAEADQQRLADLSADNAVLRERLQASKAPALRISTSAPSKGARRLKTASARR
jgi:chromosome segregation ATPase